MSKDCTEICWRPVKCTECRRTKAPRGRSVPAEAATGYCSYDCEGYEKEPKPGHLWPEEKV